MGSAPDRLVEGIERRCADIAENDADAPEREGPKPEVTGPSWVSVDVMLAVMKVENASSLESIRRLLTLPPRL